MGPSVFGLCCSTMVLSMGDPRGAKSLVKRQ
jgi:hypothetical protein